MKNPSEALKTSLHPQILGVGTPLLDVLIPISKKFLLDLNWKPGSAEAIDYNHLCQVISECEQPPKYVAGGCVTNTIKGLGCLRQHCSLFGKIGDDAAGDQLVKGLQKAGVSSLLQTTSLPTGQVLCLITPDKERTMRYFLGAGVLATAEDILETMFKDIKLVHTEGYMLNNGPLLERTMKLAKESGAKISFDTASVEMAKNYTKEMQKLISNYVDILFANEDEAHALTGEGPEKSASLLSEICEIAVVKMGAQGCWVAKEKEKIYHKAFSVTAIDTTGAGDLFASGFLHGYLQEKPLKTCAYYGNFIAAQVVQIIGAEINQETWEEIRQHLMD